MPCEIVASANVAGSCPCGEAMNPPHLVDGVLRCKNCCSEHGEKAFKEWQGEAETVGGEQGGFGF